jgi:pyridoxal phosphate enzyme (YggS family)
MDEKQLLVNLKEIYRKMAHAAMRAGREPSDVALIPVTKNVSIEVIRTAVDVGLRVFGENRVQEAQRKVNSEVFRAIDERIRWHFIGHLQKNKVKAAVELFDLIQSVDSVELAEMISKQAKRVGKTQRIFIQVKLSDEESKSGIIKTNLASHIERIWSLPSLKVEGLMTIPPFFDEAEKVRPYFHELRIMRDGIEKAGIKLHELSMGMSHDFEVAIEEGATMVRIGTALFGEREEL